MEFVNFIIVGLSVKIIRPEVDGLAPKQELRRGPSEEALEEFQIVFDA